MIRRGLTLVGFLVLVPTPAYAHTVGPGAGVEIELLLVAGAVLFFGFRLRSSPRVKRWVPGATIGAAVALGAIAVALPATTSSSRPSNVSLRIVSPADGDRVPAGSPFEVHASVRGATVARSASDAGKGHLHVYVDGQLQQMPYSTTTDVRLPQGQHEIGVEFVDPQHVSYSPPIQTSVVVTAAGDGSSAAMARPRPQTTLGGVLERQSHKKVV